MFFAQHRNSSTLQFHQLLGYGQSEAGTSIFSGDTRIGLAEAVKDGVEFFGGYTNAGITHFDSDPTDILLITVACTIHMDRTRMGELHGIADQVD